MLTYCTIIISILPFEIYHIYIYSSIADLDEVASSEDSDEPGTTCKKEALVEVHDLVDSDNRH